MPIPFAPFVAWLLGLALAWAARGERADRALAETRFVTSRPFAVSAALAGFVYLPIVAYFAAFHGDWSHLYLVPARAIPSAIDLVLVLGASACIPLGLAAGAQIVRAHTMGPLARLALGPALLGFIFAWIFARRLAVSGSYAQFHGQFGTEPIGASALGRGVLAASVTLAIGTAWSIRALKKPL